MAIGTTKVRIEAHQQSRLGKQARTIVRALALCSAGSEIPLHPTVSGVMHLRVDGVNSTRVEKRLSTLVEHTDEKNPARCGIFDFATLRTLPRRPGRRYCKAAIRPPSSLGSRAKTGGYAFFWMSPARCPCKWSASRHLLRISCLTSSDAIRQPSMMIHSSSVSGGRVMVRCSRACSRG